MVVENNPHYQTVAGSMEQFLELTDHKQRAVVAEGGMRTPGSTIEDSYRLGGGEVWRHFTLSRWVWNNTALSRLTREATTCLSRALRQRK